MWKKPQGKRPRAGAGPRGRRTRMNGGRWTPRISSRPGWLVSPDGDHRLLRSRDRRLAAVEDGHRAGGCELPSRTRCATARSTSATELTLRSDNGLVFGAKAFVAVVRRYGVEPGVHHALHARAERDDRALLQDAKSGMRVAAPLPRSGPPFTVIRVLTTETSRRRSTERN